MYPFQLFFFGGEKPPAADRETVFFVQDIVQDIVSYKFAAMGRRNQSSVSWTRVVLAAVLLLGTLCIPDARAQRGGGGAVHGQAATAQANEKAAAEEAAKTHADRQAALEAHTAKAKEADDASIEAAAAAAEANAVEANAAEANAAEANVEAAAEMPAQEVAEDPPAAPSDANLDASPGTSARSITSANAALYTEAGEVARWSSSYDANKYYKRIRAAADAGHPDAQLSLAYAQLFGNVTEQVMHDIPAARDTFLALAEQGNPQAQHAAGFLYAMGIGVNSDQAKALVHLTFSALGGDTFAQMALGYRYHVGSGVAASCETALSFYRKAAARVESEVVLTGGEVIERIRLSDEVRAAYFQWRASQTPPPPPPPLPLPLPPTASLACSLGRACAVPGASLVSVGVYMPVGI